MDSSTSTDLIRWMTDFLHLPEPIVRQIAESLKDSVIGPFGAPMKAEEYNEFGFEQLLAPIGGSHCLRLVKYYSDTVNQRTGINYSRHALETNTVHISRPTFFNDPFDCLPGVDVSRAELGLLKAIAEYLRIDLPDDGDLEQYASRLADAVNSIPADEYPQVSSVADKNKVFMQNQFMGASVRASQSGSFTQQGLLEFARQQVDGFLIGVRSCRIACFSTDPRNLYMWSHYANEHKGFCVEYETAVPSKEAELPAAYYGSLLRSIYSVFYHLNRPDNTALAIDWLTKPIGEDDIKKIYARILCAKGFNWVFERECRLIIQDESYSDDVPFLPIRKVYVGKFMPEDRKEELLRLCVEKRIPVVCMDLEDSAYELKEKPLYMPEIG